MKSEMKMPRDREMKFQNNSREFSRNETLAGYCHDRHRQHRHHDRYRQRRHHENQSHR